MLGKMSGPKGVPKVSGNDGGGADLGVIAVDGLSSGTGKRRWGKGKHTRMTTLGQKSGFYNPMGQVVGAIEAALDPDDPGNREVEDVLVEEHGAGRIGVRVRAQRLETRDRATLLKIYGKKVWLPNEWFEDLGDGTCKLARKVLLKKPWIKKAIERHRAMVSALVAGRKGKT